MKIMGESSIKKVTVTSCFSGILLVFVLASMIANEVMVRWLTQNFDENLSTKISLMQTLTEYDDESLEFELDTNYMSEYSQEINPEYYQVWTGDGITFDTSESLGDSEMEFRKTANDFLEVLDTILLDGRSGRVAYITYYPTIDDQDEDDIEEADIADSSKIENQQAMLELQKKERTDEEELLLRQYLPLVTMAIARERESLDREIALANGILFSFFAILLIMLTAIVWWSVKRGLKPLHDLQHKVETIDFIKPGNYVVLDKKPAELNGLIKKFNSMLDSVREGFSREKQFSSDVAHELKTPISEIRTISEVALIDQNADNVLARPLKDVLNVSIQMGQLVNKLLDLASTEGRANDLIPEKLNTEELIKNTINVHQKQMDLRKISINYICEGNGVINTSSVEFSQIVNNLISNAVRYGREGSEVNITWGNLSEKFSFKVENLVDDLLPGDMNNLFQRLWKKDGSRSDLRHSGIGLSLVKVYCEQLAYDIFTTLDNDKFSIVISGNDTVN